MSSEPTQIVPAMNGLSGRAVAVVIPNWNGASHLRRCLAGLVEQSRPADRVVVVDNGSVDDSVAMMRSEFPWVEIIELDTNTGFAPAVNLGIRSVGTPLIALLNNDAVPDRQWLAALLSAESSAGPDIGFLASKIVTADGRFIDSAGDYLDDAGIAHQRGNGEPDHGQYDGQCDAFSACGCATMYRTEMLSDVGHFDDDFFAYYEDVDLCLRARLRGWRGIYVGAAVVQHAVSATSGSMTSFKLFQGVRNSWFVLVKGMPARLLPAVLPRFLTVQALWALRALRAGDLGVVLRAYTAVFRAFPKLLAKRRVIQGGSTLPAAELATLLVPAGMRNQLSSIVRSRLSARMLSVARFSSTTNPDAAVRYSAILDSVRLLPASAQVLEVGSGSVGISEYLDARVVGIDGNFAATAELGNRGLLRVSADAGRLPFADAVFDATVSADMLEHVPSTARPAVLAEMLRVTRPGGVVVVTAPMGRSANWADGLIDRLYLRRTGSGHPWLSEHLATGLPSVDGVRSILEALPTASVTVFRNAPLWLWIPLQGMALKTRRRPRIERLVGLLMYLARSLPPSYRRVFVIRR
jgi:GT2 family glycosyltransferase/SAM-dependent methyltransferase